jgi:hypothetical protein
MNPSTSWAAVICVATAAHAQVNLRATPVNPGGQAGSAAELETLRGQTGSAGGFDGPSGPGYDLDWYTIDGGGATYLTGSGYMLGATAGQPDAGFMSGGQFELGGGFWYGVLAQASCYANCDNSTVPPILNANDFQCFLNAYAAGLAYANCDGSTVPPVLNANDFQCFLNAYAAGCS